MEVAVAARLEAAMASGAAAASHDFDAPEGPSDPAVVTYDEFVAEAVGRLTAAAGKIGRKVLDATKVLTEVFAVTKDLLVQGEEEKGCSPPATGKKKGCSPLAAGTPPTRCPQSCLRLVCSHDSLQYGRVELSIEGEQI